MLNKLKEPLQKLWKEKGFDQPTEIQEQSFDPILQGKDLVGISPTGTGKTLAYLLPLLNEAHSDQTLQIIVLAPSQELAIQITNVAREWADPLGLRVLPMVGGANTRRQIDQLSDKPEIIIGTPGRLNELDERTRRLRLHEVEHLVLDEADYFFGSDNLPAIQEFQKRLRRSAQILYFSATYGEDLRRFVERTDDPIEVVIVDAERGIHNLEHLFIETTNRRKFQQLRRLAAVDDLQALVFFEQIHEAEDVGERLAYHGVPVGLLHGQQTPQERAQALRLFRQGKLKLLLTTDVGARGLDIDDVPMVIHYNRVDELDTYLHRSGRTGRMGKFGQVLSLVNEQEKRDLEAIVSPANITLQECVTFKGTITSPQECEVAQESLPESRRPADKRQRPSKKKKKKNRARNRRNIGRRSQK